MTLSSRCFGWASHPVPVFISSRWLPRPLIAGHLAIRRPQSCETARPRFSPGAWYSTILSPTTLSIFSTLYFRLEPPSSARPFAPSAVQDASKRYFTIETLLREFR
jgi:hypothetical protein